VEIKLRALQS